MPRNSTTQQALDALTKQEVAGPGCSSSAATATTPGGGSGYEPAYPSNNPVDASVQGFITRFFEVSDDPDRDDEWVGFFEEDAALTMGRDVARGVGELRALRGRMWEAVEARKHRLVKVFPAGGFSGGQQSADGVEFMIFGAVAYRMREGKGDAVVGWAGHARLRRDGAGAPWRFGFYRVYK